MIRYYLDETVQSLAASRCEHPKLARLRGRGPWVATDTPDGGVMLQRGSASSWGEIKPGIGGLRYQLAAELPPIKQAIAINDVGQLAWVDLPGIKLPVKLALYAPVSIGIDGAPEGPCDDYGQLSARLWDRLNADDLPVADPQLVEFARLALMSRTNLTHELCHAYGLITTETIPAIFDAANSVPKADCGGG